MRVVYVSYDGALDPLGASQVTPYLLGLAQRGIQITLLSFEKRDRWADRKALRDLLERLGASGIRWEPLLYHRRPRVPATLGDCLAGRRAIARAVQRSGASLVHCRGDVAMAMARWARLPAGTRLLYDMRGFFSDERVESGSWLRGSLLDRAVRRVEAGNLQRAHGIVVLTEAAREILASRCPRLPPLRVIPTCADLSLFTARTPGTEPEFGLVYSGSLGTWYMAEEMVAFARAASAWVPGRALFLTPQVEEVRSAGATADWAEVRSVPPAEVPTWLRRARALFFFIRATPAKRASCPTKLAEGLGSGLPIVANRGIGDLDAILEQERVGVLVEGFSPQAYGTAAERLAGLLQDPEASARCRRLAEMRYSVQHGVSAYNGLYLTVGSSGGRG